MLASCVKSEYAVLKQQGRSKLCVDLPSRLQVCSVSVIVFKQQFAELAETFIQIAGGPFLWDLLRTIGFGHAAGKGAWQGNCSKQACALWAMQRLHHGLIEGS